jgi:hypothetical protein
MLPLSRSIFLIFPIFISQVQGVQRASNALSAQFVGNFSKIIDEYSTACYNPAAFVLKGAIQFLSL